MLAKEWHDTVWYTLESADSDPVVFLSHVLGAIEKGLRSNRDSPAIRHFQTLIRRVPLNNLEGVLARLVNHIDEHLTHHLAFVLDDYHLVSENDDINDIMCYLLLHLPARLHFVIASRRTPPFPFLAKWRVSGTIVELTEYDLRFDEEEARDFYLKGFAIELDPKQVTDLLSHVEGWAIGLQILGQLLSTENGEPSPSTDGKRGQQKQNLSLECPHRPVGVEPISRIGVTSGSPLFAYFSQEVLDRQKPELREFMLKTSVFETFSPELCNAIIGNCDADAMIATLLDNNLFLVQIGDDWFKYHSLFREFLRQRLKRENSDEYSRLNRVAGDYFHRAGDMEQAVHHYLEAGEWSMAARDLEVLASEIVRAGNYGTFLRLFERLPARVVPEFPQLLLNYGRTFEFKGDLKSAQHWYSMAEGAFREKGDYSGLAAVETRRGHIRVWFNSDPKTAQLHYDHAAKLALTDSRVPHAELLSSLAISFLSIGNVEKADQFFRQSLEVYRAKGDTYGEARVLANPGSWICFLKGQFNRALLVLDEARQILRPSDSKAIQAEIEMCRSVNLCYSSCFEEAKEAAQAALELDSASGGSSVLWWAEMALGYVFNEQDPPDREEALKHLRSAYENASLARDQRATITSLNGLLRVYHKSKDYEERDRLLNQCLTHIQHTTDLWQMAFTLANTGAVLAYSDTVRAEEHLEQARSLFAKFGDIYNIAFVDYWLSYVEFLKEGRVSAERLASWVRAVYSNGFMSILRYDSTPALALLSEAYRAGIEPYMCMHLMQAIKHKDIITQAGGGKHDGLPNAGTNDSEQSCHPSEAQSSLIRIFTLGRFAVELNGQYVKDSDWGGKKVKDFLKYLVLHYPKQVLIDELIEVLWPNLEPQKALRSLYKTIYRLRTALDPSGVFDRNALVSIRHGTVSLNTPAEIDFVAFLDLVRKARDIDDDNPQESRMKRALTLYQAAEAVYQGDLLPENAYDDWALSLREHLRVVRLQALERMGDILLSFGQLSSATECYRNVIQLDPCLESAHIKLMDCLLRQGFRALAIDQYRKYRRSLQEVLGVEPSPEMEEMAKKLFETCTS